MLYLLLLGVAVLGVGVYLLFFVRLVPGAAEERLGVLEPLPKDVGKWQVDDASPEAQAARAQGQRREVRVFFEEGTGLFGQGRLLAQARYRNLETNAIERTEPERLLKRRRIRK